MKPLENNRTTNAFIEKLKVMYSDTPEFVKLLMNFFPVFGVLFLNWDYMTVIMAYIAETFIIGVVNIFKILQSRGLITKKQFMTDLIDSINNIKGFLPANMYKSLIDGIKDLRDKEEKPNKYSGIAKPRENTRKGRIFAASFFAFHFNLFVIFQAVFVIVMSNTTVKLSRFLDVDFIFGIVLFAVTYVISYRKNYVEKKQYLKASPDILMFSPYGRVMIQQITIIIGSFLLTVLNTPVFMVIILILLKMFFNLLMHKAVPNNKIE